MQEIMLFFSALIPILAFSMFCENLIAEDDNWKVSLKKKAELFEQNVLKRHWIDGLYPSSVEIPSDGRPVDQTTTGTSNVAHSINWTSYYLGGQCYRYLFTRDEAVLEHCNKVFRAILRCLKVTGVRGLLSRGYVFGHGPSYEERGGSSKSNYWRQGTPPFENLRWRGDPSHHNYSGAAYAFGIFYDLVAQGEEKELCRDAIDALVSYWLDNDFIIWDYERERPVPILGFTDGKTPNTRIIMAAAALKVAHHATGKQKFIDAYEKLVTQYQFRTYRKSLQGKEGFDDPDHVFQHLENLFRIETDPKLKEFYRHVADELWEAHKHDCQSLFNYIYISLVPDSPDREQALKDALWTLHTYPTNKIFRPRMNSIRDDIEIVDGRAKRPLPMYESPWDNEYQWKGNLYKLDGWLARDIVSLAVSREDEMVLFAADSRGDIYMSTDSAGSWKRITENLNARVRKVATGNRVRFLFVAADNGFYKTTTGGTSWSKMPLPSDSGTPMDIAVDTKNPNVLYAITSEGIYCSIDHGEKWIGQRWESLTDKLPPARNKRFYVGLGEPTRFYAVLDNVVFSKALNTVWERGSPIDVSEYVRVYSWFAIDTANTERVFTGFKVNYGEFKGSKLSVSEDAGKTWSAGLKKLYEKYKEGGLSGLLEGMINQDVNDLRIDPHEPEIIYAATKKGIMKSNDNGKTWRQCNKGLDIPLVRYVYAPRETEKIYCSTPAGLFVSEDKGERWKNANLTLIFEDNKKREVGSADFLDAYWRGRYYGFITDGQATADPETWSQKARKPESW